VANGLEIKRIKANFDYIIHPNHWKLQMKVLKTLSHLYVIYMNLALKFYEELLGTSTALRFETPQIGLELAQVGDI
jgi:hypothetical protein